MSDYMHCEHCEEYTPLDNICEVPVPPSKHNPATEIVLFVCHDCYDEVCDEEGIDPQTLEPLI